MSISPAQMVFEIASEESPGVARRSAPGSLPTGATEPAPPAQSAASAPAVTSSPQFSTDLRIDDQHQIYYEFVDKGTGEVLFEIPPEAFREIGESLNVPLDASFVGHSVDTKS